MSDIPVKARFAPSPTGWLHIGNLRTALFNILFARRHQGVFLLRIEDTDEERSRREYVDDLQEDLRWLDMHWQEGPGQNRGNGPYFQSERGALYQKYYELLEQQGDAYYCFCSDVELSMARRRQLAAGQAPRYPGTCARMSREEAARRITAGERPALRFRVPRGKLVEFVDLVRGPQQFASEDIGDFIIRRANGAAAFFFCNAIDDALMGVTHVLRGEDHLTNTPRQIMILGALALRVPEYGHISMIVGHDGAPLSKRHGSRSIRELRAAGYLPAAVVNYLARLGHHFEDERLGSLDDLARQFDIARLGRSPARYDADQLLHWQREAVGSASDETLWQWMGEQAQRLIPEAQRAEFLATVRPNIVLPEDALRWARIVYHDPLDWSDAARAVMGQAGAGFFAAAAAALERTGADFKALVAEVKAATGAKGKALFEPLRAALTGELDGPELARLLGLLGARRVKLRLESAQALVVG